MSKITDFFPLETARKSQLLVLDEIQKAYEKGYKYVILEAPVGSGKSAIAITVANWLKDAHVLTPRRALQNQYFEDFKEHAVLMKGRSSYPCTYEKKLTFHNQVLRQVDEGFIPQPKMGEVNCGNAPCLTSDSVKKDCFDHRECPYHRAIKVANSSETIIHNLHSFIFQIMFADRFSEREVLIIDECHEIEGIVREFCSVAISLKCVIKKEERPTYTTIPEWTTWFRQERFVKQFADVHTKIDSDETERSKYLDKLDDMDEAAEYYKDKFAVQFIPDLFRKTTQFKFIPENIGAMAHKLLFSWGRRRLLMSGTIYSKEQFCRNLGITEEAAYFIRIGSSFPVENRPIIFKDEYKVDTSHKTWDTNFGEMVSKITTLLGKFPDAKGLIHTPSYMAAAQLAVALKNPRIMGHEPETFQSRLDEFFREKHPKVFISPVCQQGVDFKDDRARFQIILRVPYGNTGDPFVEHKVKTDFPWYNYQALVTFGQQIGRINRSESDFGMTILMDSRFEGFLKKNQRILPKWLLDSIKYK